MVSHKVIVAHISKTNHKSEPVTLTWKAEGGELGVEGSLVYIMRPCLQKGSRSQ